MSKNKEAVKLLEKAIKEIPSEKCKMGLCPCCDEWSMKTAEAISLLKEPAERPSEFNPKDNSEYIKLCKQYWPEYGTVLNLCRRLKAAEKWERLYTECNTERLEYLHQTEQLEATLKAAYAEIKDLRDVAIDQEEKLIDCEIITKRLEAAEAAIQTAQTHACPLCKDYLSEAERALKGK